MSHRYKRYLILACTGLITYATILGKKTFNPDASFTFASLDKVASPLDYLHMLVNFEVIDFQPVRDLSFFLDIFLFRQTGVVTFATINVLLWILSAFLILRLLERIVPENKSHGLIFWVLPFMVFPLFSQAVCWGMARKHILAFPLYLAATHSFLDWMEDKSTWLKPYLFYVAAALSQPLTLFWPVWASVHFYIKRNSFTAGEKKVFGIFFITTAVLLFTHYAYYTVGNQTVADVFGMARPRPTNIMGMIINLLHYGRQIVFPYEMGFLYFPTLSTVWPGIVLIIGISVFLWYFRKDREMFSWLVFALVPLPVFMPLTGSIYDQYLIIPVCGLLILLVRAWNKDSKILKGSLISLTILWSAFTFQQAKLWVDPVQVNARNFRNSTSCKSALFYGYENYMSGQRAPQELLSYLINKGCFQTAFAHAPASRNWVISVEAMMLYFEESAMDLEQRLNRLDELGNIHFYPKLLKAALFARLDQKEEVEKNAAFVLERTGGNLLELGPLVPRLLGPYCERNNLPACLKVIRPKSIPGYL